MPMPAGQMLAFTVKSLCVVYGPLHASKMSWQTQSINWTINQLINQSIK